MASPPPKDARRPIARNDARRRAALVFAATLGAHLLVFQAVGTQVFRPHFDLSAYETPATPLAFASPPKLATKPKPAAKSKLVAAQRLPARLSPALAPAPIEIARAEPPPAGEPGDLAAPGSPRRSRAPAAIPDQPRLLARRGALAAHQPHRALLHRAVEHHPLHARALQPHLPVRLSGAAARPR